MKYLIYSEEHTPGTTLVWLGPNRRGYTTDVESAGRYSKVEADAIVADSRGQEIAISEMDVAGSFKWRRVVDTTDADNLAKLHELCGREKSTGIGDETI